MTTPDQPGDHVPQRSPHIQALEAQLAALRPRADRLDRDRLIFFAGQASAPADLRVGNRSVIRWAASLGAIGGAAAASVAMLIVRPDAWTPPAGNDVVAGATEAAERDPPSRAADRLLTARLSLARIEKLLADDHGSRPVDEFHGAAGDSPVDPGSVLSTRSFEQVL